MRIKTAVFDLDDTLYDYARLHGQALLHAAQACSKKLDVSQNDFLQAFSKARDSIKRHMQDCASRHNRMLYFQRTAELLGRHPLDMYECCRGYLLAHMRLADGAEECLRHLKKQGIKIGICTDLTAHIQHRKLKQLQIDEYVDVFAGDSYHKDVLGAARAGMFPVWMTESAQKGRSDSAVKTVRSFQELEEFLSDGKNI